MRAPVHTNACVHVVLRANAMHMLRRHADVITCIVSMLKSYRLSSSKLADGMRRTVTCNEREKNARRSEYSLGVPRFPEQIKYPQVGGAALVQKWWVNLRTHIATKTFTITDKHMSIKVDNILKHKRTAVTLKSTHVICTYIHAVRMRAP